MKMTEDPDSILGGIRMGVNVDIKRTDGKVIQRVPLRIIGLNRVD